MMRARNSVWTKMIARVSASASVLALVGASLASAATEPIQFPEEELASESVLPIFDNPVSVKNRSVTLPGRFELGVVGGMSLLEPFYNPLTFGGTASYHWSEESGINLTGLMYLQGLSGNGQGLNPIPNTVTGTNPNGISANLQYAPAPKYLLLANYQFTGFYGKISLTKDFTMNLGLYGFAGLGAIGVGDAVKPIANIGVGQKFYFTPNFALRFDYRFMAYSGPNVLSRPLDKETGPVPASSMTDQLMYASVISTGVVFLFPRHVRPL